MMMLFIAPSVWPLCECFLPYLVKLSLDNYGKRTDTSFLVLEDTSYLIAYIGLFCVAEILMRLQQILFLKIAPLVQKEGERSLLKASFSLKVDYFDKNPPSLVGQSMNNASEASEQILTTFFYGLYPLGMACLALVVLSSFVSAGLALFYIFWMSLMLYVSLRSSSFSVDLAYQTSRLKNTFFTQIHSTFRYFPLLKFYNTQGHDVGRLSLYQEEAFQSRKKEGLWGIKIDLLRSLLSLVLFLGSFAWVYNAWQKGTLTLGDVFFLISVSLILRKDVWIGSLHFLMIQRSMGILKESLKFLEDLEKSTSSQRTSSSLTHPSLEVSHLWFGYEQDLLLKDVSFVINPGEKVALRGANGCGKSTLMRLLSGFLSPTQGHVVIGDENTCGWTFEDYRSLITYIPQEVPLLNRTLFETLAMGLEKQKMDKIETLPVPAWIRENLHTPLGELGWRLSAGEKQAVWLTKALLEDKPIVLLDESTSYLDDETENYFLDLLLKDPKRMVLFVTHRTSCPKKFHRHLTLCDSTIKRGTS